MGEDLDVATAVSGGGGRYTSTLSPAWDIWGPVGGYVAVILLRSAAAHSQFPRPASITCHFLGVARFEPVELNVVTLRRARAAESVQVTMSQGDRVVATALCWFTGGDAGLEHDESEMPDVPGPSELVTLDERMAAAAAEPKVRYPFWDNIEERPVRWSDQWPPPGPIPASWQVWCRYRPTATFDDPVVDAGRYLMLADFQWPAATNPHAHLYPDGMPPFVAPTLDLAVQFHRFAPTDPDLLLDARAAVATGGLIGGSAQVWSSDGQLLASGAGQLLCRAV